MLLGLADDLDITEMTQGPTRDLLYVKQIGGVVLQIDQSRADPSHS